MALALVYLLAFIFLCKFNGSLLARCVNGGRRPWLVTRGFAINTSVILMGKKI